MGMSKALFDYINLQGLSRNKDARCRINNYYEINKITNIIEGNFGKLVDQVYVKRGWSIMIYYVKNKIRNLSHKYGILKTYMDTQIK